MKGALGVIALPATSEICPCFLVAVFTNVINGDKPKNLSESLATNYFPKHFQDAKCLEMFAEAEANTESKIMKIKHFLAQSRLMMSGLITAI